MTPPAAQRSARPACRTVLRTDSCLRLSLAAWQPGSLEQLTISHELLLLLLAPLCRRHDGIAANWRISVTVGHPLPLTRPQRPRVQLPAECEATRASIPACLFLGSFGLTMPQLVLH
jgi:hypothetical protein